MAKPLTTINEPGFFSEIKENPSLFLTPGSVQTVAIIGEGKSTKSTIEDAAREPSPRTHSPIRFPP